MEPKKVDEQVHQTSMSKQKIPENTAISSPFKSLIPPLETDYGMKEGDNGYIENEDINVDIDSLFEEDDENESDNCVYKVQQNFSSMCTSYSSFIGKAVLLICIILYTIYFGFAIAYSIDLAKSLIIITCIVLFVIVYVFVRDHFGTAIYNKCWLPATTPISNRWDTIQWFLYPGIIIVILLYLIFFVVKELKQLQSISGIVIFILFTYFTSKKPDKIYWRPVIWGYTLQFALAIFVLRWKGGYKFVEFLGDEITKFINYSYEGSATVFGDPWMVFHPFFFLGGGMIIYMGAVLSILYYYGVTQVLAAKMAWLMQKTMNTTAIETLGVASNIFLNGMDTMLMLRKYLDKLTPSEFHTFLVGGHSTVAGFIFGLFVLFGAPPQHLLSAAVMSAPAVIAITKLNYPETKKSITARVEDVKLERGSETNVFEACANGASVAGKTVGAVMINYIAFIGILAFFNSTLSWLGGRVGYPQLSFELICSYIFYPIAVIIGVDLDESREVAKLIGIKCFTTEILAYQELGVSARAGLLNDRSQTLATYALCGFSSLSTLAVAVGIWTVVCPQRVKEMAKQMFRALVNANVACFMTACIAGVMYRDDLTIEEEEAPAIIGWFMGIIPSYKDLMALVPGLLP